MFDIKNTSYLAKKAKQTADWGEQSDQGPLDFVVLTSLLLMKDLMTNI